MATSPPSFEDLKQFLLDKYHMKDNEADSYAATRCVYLQWMDIGSMAVDAFLKEVNYSGPHQALIESLRPPARPVIKKSSIGPVRSYDHLRGGISGKVKEAMAKKAIKLYTIQQLQTIVRCIKSMQSSLGLKTSEEIEVRVHAFPKEREEKSYPLEVTLHTQEQMRRYFIDAKGELQWEQRYNCELTYDTYGPMTEGEDIESGDDD